MAEAEGPKQPEKKARPKYKSFPKRNDGKKLGGESQRPIDFEKLRALYLSGPDFDWKTFCTRHGFNPTINRDKWKALHGVDFKDWKKDWLKQQAGMQDDEIVPELLATRKLIGTTRIAYVKDWVNRSKYMKVLLDAMLSTHGDDLKHDQKNPSAQKRFRLNPRDFASMATTAQRLQEIEQRALLLVPAMLPGEQAGAKAALEEDEEEAPQMLISTIGESGLDSREAGAMLAGYFDQFEKKSEPKPAENPKDVTDAEVVPG